MSSSRISAAEPLESRIAPATIVVLNLNDAGAGSLREAVETANATPAVDTIIFRRTLAGVLTLTTGDIDISDDLTIRGLGNQVIINGADEDRIFDISDEDEGTTIRVTLSRLALTHGTSVEALTGDGDEGGAVRSFESLTLLNSTITSSSAVESGGAVYVETAGRFSMRGSRIVSNDAEFGGGLDVRAEQGIAIVQSVIAGNSAVGNGGGLFAQVPADGTGDILIDRTTVSGNISAANGGGIFAGNARAEGRIAIRSSAFSGNQATSGSSEGGGLLLDDGAALISRTTISNNAATRLGGGLADDFLDSLTITGSKIIGNRTTVDGLGVAGGGGVYLEGSHAVTIHRSTISDNTSESSGGGIAARSGIALSLSRATVSGNAALGVEGNGGGLDTSGAGAGGAVNVSIVSSIIAGNSATDGGGIRAAGDGDVLLRSSRLTGNIAAGDGGGARLQTNAASGQIEIISSLIAENASDFRGGGLAIDGDSFLTRSRVLNNFSLANGGGIRIFSGQLEVAASQLTGNVSSGIGGGIRNDAVEDVIFVGARSGDPFGKSRVSGNIAFAGADLSQ